MAITAGCRSTVRPTAPPRSSSRRSSGPRVLTASRALVFHHHHLAVLPSVPGSSRLCPDPPVCDRVLPSVTVSSRLCPGPPVCARVLPSVPGSSRLCPGPPVHRSSDHQVLRCFSLASTLSFRSAGSPVRQDLALPEVGTEHLAFHGAVLRGRPSDSERCNRGMAIAFQEICMSCGWRHLFIAVAE